MAAAATGNVERSSYTLWGIRDLPQALLHGLKALAHLLLLGVQPMEGLTGGSHTRSRVARLGSDKTQASDLCRRGASAGSLPGRACCLRAHTYSKGSHPGQDARP